MISGYALVKSGQVSGSDVESWYGYYTVLLLTLPYVHEFEYQEIVICIYTYYIRAMQKCRGRRGRGLLTTCAISAYHHWCCECGSRSGPGDRFTKGRKS